MKFQERGISCLARIIFYIMLRMRWVLQLCTQHSTYRFADHSFSPLIQPLVLCTIWKQHDLILIWLFVISILLYSSKSRIFGVYQLWSLQNHQVNVRKDSLLERIWQAQNHKLSLCNLHQAKGFLVLCLYELRWQYA